MMQKKSNTAISVIIPVFNAEKYLERCIKSIQNQTVRNFEALFIDDHSTDQSAAILAELIREDPRFRYIKPENKLGAGNARNTGIDLAKGKYICMMDADDILPTDSLRLRLEAIHKYRSDLVFGSSLFIYPEYETVSKKTETLKINIRAFDEFKNNNLLTFAHWSAIFEKKFISDNECMYGTGIVGQDMVFLLSVLLSNPKITLIPDIVYIYDNHCESAYHRKKTLDHVLALLIPYQFAIEKADNEEKKLLAQLFIKRRFAGGRDLVFTSMLDKQERILVYKYLKEFICKNNL